MATIHSINKALLALGLLMILANFLIGGRGYWFSNMGIFLVILSAVLSAYLIYDQKKQITAHKEKIAMHESTMASQKAQIEQHETTMANQKEQIAMHETTMATQKEQIADMKQAQTEASVAPVEPVVLAAPVEPAAPVESITPIAPPTDVKE